MEQMGVSPKRSLGQNFLINDHVIEKIICRVEKFKKENKIDWMLEIGPGLGALTRRLRILDGNMSLLELDREFAQYWRQEGLDVLEGDALQVNWQPVCGQGQGILVSNLPYQISSSLVVERSIDPLNIMSMVLMFQKEVAQKIIQPCGSSEYGFLSVIAQSFWSIEKVIDAGRGAFYPSPNVASRVLSFLARDVGITDRKRYLEFVKSAFSHRRKLVMKNIRPFLQKYNLSQEKFVENLQELGYNVNSRAQEISIENYLEIFKSF